MESAYIKNCKYIYQLMSMYIGFDKHKINKINIIYDDTLWLTGLFCQLAEDSGVLKTCQTEQTAGNDIFPMVTEMWYN